MLVNIKKIRENSEKILTNKIVHLLDGQIKIPLEDILERFYGSPDDIIILGGTLVEGCGNLYSDLDILVLSEKLPSTDKVQPIKNSKWVYNACKTSKDGSRWSTHDYYMEDGLQIEFQYTDLTHFSAALDQIHRVFGNLKELRDNQKKTLTLSSPSSFDHNYKEMFHRMLTGIPIQGNEKFYQLISQIPIEELCIAYYAWSRISYSDFKDILGAIHSKNLDNAVHMTVNMLVGQMRALSHLLFNTNDKPKWSFYYIQQLPENLTSLKKKFQDLIQLSRSNEQEKMELIEKAFDLMDDIFFISNCKLDENFTILNRKDSYESFVKNFEKRNSNHRQILRQFAFVERYCSKKFIPSKEFINPDHKIAPCLHFM